MIHSKVGNIQADKIYKTMIASAGILAILLFGRIEPALNNWQELSLFVILLFISNISGTRLSSGITFSVGFIIELAVIQIFGVETAVVVTFVTLMTVNIIGSIINSSKALLRGLLNTSTGTITVLVTGLIFSIKPEPVGGFVAASLVYFFVNVTLLSSLQYIESPKENSVKNLWVDIGKEISLNYFVLAPLAFLIPFVFNSVNTQNKLFFVLLFFVPVMLVSYSYRLYVNIRQSYLNTVKTLVAAIEAKDPYVKGHAERVAKYALAIARDLGYSDRDLARLQYIALLHDAGKIGIKDYILNKPGSLTPEEFNEVKEHSVIGAQIIGKIKFLSSGANIVKYHHERFDGSGYPEGLTGFDIPEGARILAVVDAFDAMTTDRPYRKAKTRLQALAEIDVLAGKQYDPQIVEVFKKVLFRQGEI